MLYLDNVLDRLCSDVQNDELRNYCYSGGILNLAKELISSEMDKDLRTIAEEYDWSIPDIDKIQECVESAVYYDTQDEVKVAKALLKAAEKSLDSGFSLREAILDATEDDEVKDVVANTVAGRIWSAIDFCREEL